MGAVCELYGAPGDGLRAVILDALSKAYPGPDNAAFRILCTVIFLLIALAVLLALSVLLIDAMLSKSDG